MNACGSRINNQRLVSRHVCIRAVGRSDFTFRRKKEMNEDDLIKGGRAAALPNGMEAGLVSHVTFHERCRSSNSDLLAPGKRDEITDDIFGRVPEDWEEEDDDDDDLAVADICGAGAGL